MSERGADVIKTLMRMGVMATINQAIDADTAELVVTEMGHKFKRVAEGDWQIEAHYPGAEIRHISGFKTKAEVDEWLAGSKRIDWLRSQGYAK